MRTRKVVNIGWWFLISLTGLIAVMAYQADRVSKHEYNWQRDKEGFRQDDFKPGEYRRMR